jgi:hypothetical protein
MEVMALRDISPGEEVNCILPVTKNPSEPSGVCFRCASLTLIQLYTRHVDRFWKSATDSSVNAHPVYSSEQ